jgi:hypothetical protein
MAADWRSQDHSSASTRLRNYLNPATEFFGAAAHAFQSLTMIGTSFVKAMAVVFQFQDYRSSLNFQRGFGCLASRVSRDIVNAFLKNQKYFSSHFRAELYIMIWVWRIKVKLNVASSESVAGKSSHSVG